jgi:hypothetical protein
MGGRDDNELAKAGKLPADPKGDAKLVMLRNGEPPARVLTVRQMLESARDAAKNAKGVRACTTGLRELDESTGGLRKGFSWLFLADTSWGKSSWLVMVADENLKRRQRVLIVTAEDDESIYGARLLARRSRVAAKRLRSGHLTDEDHAAIDKQIQAAETMPAFLDARGKTAEWVAKQVRRIVREERIDVVFVDYLQELPAERPTKDQATDLENRGRVIRHACKESGVASVIFSQITIDAKKPELDKNSVRGSRAVAHGADVILCGLIATKEVTLYRRVNGFNEPCGTIAPGAKLLKLDKCKNAPVPQFVPLKWDDDTASFTETIDPPDEFGDFDDAARGFDEPMQAEGFEEENPF